MDDQSQGADGFYNEIRSEFIDQLHRREIELDLLLKEKKEEFKRYDKDRETVGIELYEAQSNLSRLMKRSDDINSKNEQMVKVTSSLSSSNEVLEGKLSELESFVADLEKETQKKERIQRLLAIDQEHIKKINQVTQSDLLVRKRENEKTNIDLIEAEKEKAKQEYILLRIGSTISSSENTVDLLAATISGLQKRLQDLTDTYALKSEDNENISERVKYVQKTVKTFEEMLQQSFRQYEDGLEDLGEKENERMELITKKSITEKERRSIQIEVKEMKQKLSKMVDEIAKSKSKKDLLAMDVDGKLMAVSAAKEKIAILETTSSDQAKIKAEMVQERDGLVDKVQKDRTKFTSLSRSIEDITSQNKALSNTARKVVTSIKKKDGDISHNVREVEVLKNLSVQQEIDTMNIRNATGDIEASATMVAVDVTEREKKLVERRKAINKSRFIMEKKLKIIEFLNNEVGRIKSEMKEGDTETPLRLMEKKLRQEIATKKKENTELGELWEKKRAEVSNSERKVVEGKNSVDEGEEALKILGVKKERVENALRETEKKLEVYNSEKRGYDTKITKLNTEIHKYERNGETLVYRNIDLEEQLVERLHVADKELGRLREDISSTIEEKNNLLRKLMSISQEVKVYEKKIEIAKSVKKALNTDYGVEEISATKLEIQLMEKRQRKLNVSNESLMKEIKQTITRINRLETRNYDIMSMKISSGKKPKSTKIRQDIDYLKRRVAQNNTKRERITMDIERTKIELEELSNHIKSLEDTKISLREMNRDLNKDISEKLKEKTHLQEIIMKKHELLRLSLKGSLPLHKAATRQAKALEKLMGSLERINKEANTGQLEHACQNISDALDIVKDVQ